MPYIFFSIIFLVTFLLFLYPVFLLNKIYDFKFSKKTLFFLPFLFTFFLFINRFFIENFFASNFINYFLGFCFVFFLFLSVFNIFYIFLRFFKFFKKNKKIFFLFPIFFSIIFFFFGVWNFQKEISVNTFEIFSDKIKKPYTILHITDPQYGSLNDADMQKIFKKFSEILEKEKIDLVLFTGDFFDKDVYFTKEQLEKLKGFDIQKPKFFSMGNHEFYHNPEEILKIIDALGYENLRGESKIFGDLNIIGIDDSPQPDQVKNFLEKKDLVKKDKFNILMYHRPTGVDDAKKYGINLMLTGHTHGGQFFPITEIVKKIYKYPAGFFEIGDDFVLYTSDGVGLWGPKIRVGTENELTIFKIFPEKK